MPSLHSLRTLEVRSAGTERKLTAPYGRTASDFVEMGSTKKKIKDILEFSQGTIIELERQAGAPVDVMVTETSSQGATLLL